MTEENGLDAPLVRIQDLHKDFILEGQRIHVLRGVDLEIHHGEMISIIGASGSGKSTFLHVLGTLDRPTRGRVEFRGEDVFRFGSAQLAQFRNRTIGFVFQFHHLLPEFSALENVLLPAQIQRQPPSAAEARAKAMLDRVGLSRRFDHRPGELSGGEQQRVSIARALMLEPELLLADEPTGNLDEESAEGIHELLEDTHRQTGLTVVLVTHRSELAGRMPRQLEMSEGQLRPVSA